MEADYRSYDARTRNWMEGSIAGSPLPESNTDYYRSIWISDFHLGTPRCKAQALFDFLRGHLAENLYLVGDVLDGWSMGPGWFWSPAQAAVIEEIVAWRRRGARVVFLPGNHDECNTDLIETLFGPVGSLRTDVIHRTAEGRRMLVIHGHQFDGSLHPTHWLSMMGSIAYTAALRMNLWYNRERSRRRRRIAAFFRQQLKDVVHRLSDFDDRRVLEIARERRVDGVICGHTHRPDRRMLGPILYLNDGDWVQSRTALVEESDGALRLLRWDAAADHERNDERPAYAGPLAMGVA